MKIHDIIMTVMTILLIVLIILSIMRNPEFPMPWAVVGSYSMEPTLKLGDIVIIGTLSSCNFMGKIIVYRNPMGEYIVHRVKKVLDGKECVVITKGDANPEEDPWRISKNMIVGEVILVIPSIGVLSLTMKHSLYNPSILIILIAIGFSLYLILALLERS